MPAYPTRTESVLHRFHIDVGEVNIEELHTANFFQLFLDPATGFEGVFQATADRLFVVFLVGVQQLQQARHGVGILQDEAIRGLLVVLSLLQNQVDPFLPLV